MKATPVLDLMIYIRTYAPHFPEEDQTTVDHEFQKLRDRFDVFGRKPMTPDARRWFDIASREVDAAARAYGDGDVDSGEQALGSAEDHLRRSIAGRKMKARFVVSPEGNVGEK